MKGGGMKITIILMISNVVVKFLGLGRDLVLANVYGTSNYSDAYIIANSIPIILFSVVAVGISTAYIPIYSEVKENNSEKAALKYTNNFLNIVLSIALVLMIIGEIFPQILVKIFASGFNQETFNITVDFTRILLPSIVAIAVMSIAGSYLQLKEDFLPISYVSIPNNLLVIISIIVSFRMNNPYILVYGTTIGMLSQLIYYYPFLKRNGFKYEYYINLKENNIRKSIKMIIPMIIGAAVNEINIIIDRTLVSGLETGSIASLNYSSKVIGFIVGVFIVSIVTIAYPKMGKLSVKKNGDELAQYIKEILSGITIIIVPITIILIMYAENIIKILFERGSFDEKSTYMTMIALMAYSVGIIGIGFREILNKTYFVLKDTRTPMINGIIAVGLNVILNIVFIKYLGTVGSALATSIVSIITVLLLIRGLRKKIGKIIDKEFLIAFIKITTSGITSVLCGRYIYDFYRNENMIHDLFILIIVNLISIIIYIGILWIMKERNILKIKGKLWEKYEK